MTPDEAARLCWSAGDAALLRLKPVQRGIRAARQEVWKHGRKSVELAARRLGKSHGFVADADAFCRQHDGALLKYAAASSVSVRDFIMPLYQTILADCPEDLRPVWHESRGEMRYGNGSVVMIAGCDTIEKANRLRGMPCDRAYVDEAAFIRILEYVVESVLMPQLMTRDGRMSMSSSAPESPEHAFAFYVRQAERDGTLIKRTIHDATHIPRHIIDEFCKEAGGSGSTTWRREYLCEIVTDAARSVIPELTEASAEAEVYLDPPTVPEYRNRYVGWDTGHVDLTVGAFGYMDLMRDTAVIEGEVVIEKATVKAIAQAGQDMERRLWGTDAPRVRVADAPPLMLASLADEGYACEGPRSERDESISRLRDAIKDRRLLVGSGCPTIRAHLSGAVWSVSGADYERRPRVGNSPAHHFDGLSAARYFVDAVDWNQDPTPPPDPRLGGGWGLLEATYRPSGLSALTLSPRKRIMERVRRGHR